MGENISLAFQGIWNHKLRSFLTMLGIIIGIAAIIAIVALGVGFLTGLLSTTPDMEASVDSWYQKTSMSDFDIKSTMGLTQEDAEAAAALPSVDKVTPARVTDVLVSSPDGDLLSARMYGMDLNDTDSVNQLTLLEGSMPEKAGECVIENPNSSMTDLSIGDTITLSEDTENLEDTYRQRTFTITGIVNSPYYFCNSEEPSSVGTGTCSVIFYTDSSAYALDTYTDLFLTVTNNGNAFSYEYEKAWNQRRPGIRNDTGLLGYGRRSMGRR